MAERKRIRPTKYSAEAGWASKFAPGDLTRDDGYLPFGGLLLQTVEDLIAPVVGVWVTA
jgi:hypothetical protein